MAVLRGSGVGWWVGGVVAAATFLLERKFDGSLGRDYCQRERTKYEMSLSSVTCMYVSMCMSYDVTKGESVTNLVRHGVLLHCGIVLYCNTDVSYLPFVLCKVSLPRVRALLGGPSTRLNKHVWPHVLYLLMFVFFVFVGAITCHPPLFVFSQSVPFFVFLHSVPPAGFLLLFCSEQRQTNKQTNNLSHKPCRFPPSLPSRLRCR